MEICKRSQMRSWLAAKICSTCIMRLAFVGAHSICQSGEALLSVAFDPELDRTGGNLMGTSYLRLREIDGNCSA